MTASFRLETAWRPDAKQGGEMRFHLFNLSQTDLRGFTLCYTTQSRIFGAAEIENGRLIGQDASFHEIAPPEGFVLGAGECWTLGIAPLWRDPAHRGDGAKSAYLKGADGTLIAVETGDLIFADSPARPPMPRLPEGRPDPAAPYALTPWPAQVETHPGDVPTTLYPVEGASEQALAAIAGVAALHHRLYPEALAPLSLIPVAGGRALDIRQGETPPAGYTLDFGPAILLTAADADGIRHGLIALAQMIDGASAAPEQFRFPASGRIEDAPRHSWRGAMLDVSRQFAPAGDVLRFLDLMAWYRFNLFHWHLTDDEGWRIEIPSLPPLTTVGAIRGPKLPIPPQLGGGIAPQGGFYSHDDIRAVVAHAATLGIDILPEVDMPGHCTALLAALPHLRDPDEPADSYRAVQGHANNALNAAIPETWEVIGTILDTLVALFPFRLIHVGGDEVAESAWLSSPRARALMQREGLAGTFELQSFFLTRLKSMLAERGRDLAGWNEVAHGGGVAREGTLLMAWQAPEIGIDLARQGYDVVMTPGQAYYLDMAHTPDWWEPGAGWAGSSTVAHSYGYEASGDFPPELAHHLKGIQTCIWTEHFTSRAYFNDLVFPRFLAIAESAWTPADGKDWQRFAAVARHHPTL